MGIHGPSELMKLGDLSIVACAFYTFSSGKKKFVESFSEPLNFAKKRERKFCFAQPGQRYATPFVESEAIILLIFTL